MPPTPFGGKAGFNAAGVPYADTTEDEERYRTTGWDLPNREGEPKRPKCSVVPQEATTVVSTHFSSR
jgi:hypothetical protein